MECVFCKGRGESNSCSCLACGEMMRTLSLEGLHDGGVFFVGRDLFPGLSLWAYRGLVREAILAFKIRGMWLSGMALVQLALQEERIQELLQDIDVVMPAPSSLWGRLRGRFDLAAILARRLSQEFAIPYVEPPRMLLGSWMKQALIPREKRGLPLESGRKRRRVWDEQYFSSAIKKSPLIEPLRVLAVDDVVTTARTLTALSDRFRNIDFRFLTLASAYRQD